MPETNNRHDSLLLLFVMYVYEASNTSGSFMWALLNKVQKQTIDKAMKNKEKEK